MRKIPTLFRRDPENPRFVTPEITPGCEWVLRGRGIATRKFDGTCVMMDNQGQWFARREVKHDKTQPAGFVAVQYDENTGKTVGWIPMEDSSYARWHTDALAHALDIGRELHPGTYELCGPRINNNPEGFTEHELIKHGVYVLEVPKDVTQNLTFNNVKRWVLGMHFEGIVWHHPNHVYMAKIKRRDFSSGD